jgi:hypothetical protein
MIDASPNGNAPMQECGALGEIALPRTAEGSWEVPGSFQNFTRTMNRKEPSPRRHRGTEKTCHCLFAPCLRASVVETGSWEAT